MRMSSRKAKLRKNSYEHTEEEYAIVQKYEDIFYTLRDERLIYSHDKNVEQHKHDKLNDNKTDDILDYPLTSIETPDGDEYTLIQIILILKNLKYNFNIWDLRNCHEQFINYLHHSGNDESEITDDFKKVIKIIMSESRAFNILEFSNNYNKNKAFQYALDVLFEIEYKFVHYFVILFCENHMTYYNPIIEGQMFLNHNMLTYCAMLLGQNVKINDTFFDKFMELIINEENPKIKLEYLLFMIDITQCCAAINMDKLQHLIKYLFNYILCINNESFFTTIFKRTISNLKYNNNIVQIIFTSTLSGKFVKLLCKLKILHKNMILLYLAMHYDYVPDISLINDLLMISETCKYNTLKLIFPDEVKYEGYDLFKLTKSTKLFTCSESLKLIPNEETFKISLSNGYTFTTKKLIKMHNFIPNVETLNMAAKSRNIYLIRDILRYKIEPTETTFECLVSGAKVGSKGEGSNLINIIKVLISNGLKINLNCISKLLSLEMHLDNLENYDIEYDEALYFECYVNNHFPDQYIDKFIMDKNIIMLRNLIDNEIDSLPKIKDFMEKNNVKFDNYMVDQITEINDKKINDIIFGNNNCVPSILTMYKRAYNGHNSKTLQQFIKRNNITKETMMLTHELII